MADGKPDKDSNQTSAPQPLLSVLIPTWNRVEPVAAAVASVGTGSGNLEIVVVDNASDPAIYSELQKRFTGVPHVRLFRNEQNIGMVRNWNRCMELSRGTWLGLLCSDDRYRVGGSARILELLGNTTDPALIVQDPTIMDEIKRCPAGNATVRELRLPIASGNFWHREVVEALGPFDERFEYSADAEYWYRIASYFPVYKVREPFAFYEQHETNYMWQTWRKADFLDQTALLARTVAGHMFRDDPERERLISAEEDNRVWSTLTTIIENSFLHKDRGDIFARYFSEAFRRAGSVSRKRELFMKLLYAAKHRLDAAKGGRR
ncbi:PGL/p-HBAD biosynthesis glycosyltransferase Rv2957/MT3031 [Geobacter sp. OR-1]|uniref:glycosyltransferase family 2 protein n=1 Tax=Geobacter sp. OR-1 TaxID=1266765 RepID=UPI0005429EE8|nr:glycosyltransferase [Geobacter sp. OR-1]GAM11006.1 PGL/p-HBAD biosynthesis glycosyltransferase Rv2957/MT3031 [Geobacter sp. OR-1]